LVPETTDMLQAPGQEMPDGFEVTEPVPVTDTVTLYDGGAQTLPSSIWPSQSSSLPLHTSVEQFHT
jgi:hypothetical protein